MDNATMLEDALKNTRNIHRLILTISFITIVFSMSIDFPKDKKQQLDSLHKLSTVPFLNYNAFVEAQVAKFELATLQSIAEKVNARLVQEGYTLFNAHHIGEAFAKNAHTGKLLTEQLFFTDINTASISQFNALSGLSIYSDIQVLVPQIDEFLDELNDYLGENAGVGRRVDGLYITYGDVSFVAESFLSNGEVYLTLYFELPSTASLGGHPVFNTQFPASVKTLPNTSFSHWLKTVPEVQGLYTDDDDQLIWLSSLENLQSGFHEEKIGLLKKQLENDIKTSSPEEQKISVLGANVPGVLFIFASPLLLLSLTYYLMNSTFHLRKLSLSEEIEDKKMFQSFSWPPLSLGNTWKFEASISLALLPYLALCVLIFQLARFGFSSFSSSAVVLAAMLIMLLPTKLIWNNLISIRSSLQKEDEHNSTDDDIKQF
jgi:hypothetical protein